MSTYKALQLFQWYS